MVRDIAMKRTKDRDQSGVREEEGGGREGEGM